MTYLLDASAVIALLKGEPGADRVTDLLSESAITLVNLAEVIGRAQRFASAPERAPAAIRQLGIPVLEILEADAIAAGLLRARTDRFGLSLGDRFCLAVARRTGVVALTADRAWGEVAEEIGVSVEMIR